MPALAPTSPHPDPTPGVTSRGRVVHLRSLRDGEHEPIQEVFDRLSTRSRFLRFHTGIPHLPPRLLRYLSTLTRGTHEASVAVVDGRTVAVARWIRLQGPAHDRRAGRRRGRRLPGPRGLARLLVATVARSARAAGISSFVCTVHPENTAGPGRPARGWGVGDAGTGPRARPPGQGSGRGRRHGREGCRGGCIGRCGTRSWVRSGWSVTVATSLRAVGGRWRCSPCCCSVVGRSWTPSGSSSWSGDTRP